MKILVDRDQIRNIFETAKHIGIYSLEKNTLVKTSDIIRICSDILIANPVESDGFKTNKEITEADRQWGEKELDKIFIYNSSQDGKGNITESIIRNPDYNPLIEIRQRLDECEDAIGNDLEDKWATIHNAIIEILNMFINGYFCTSVVQESIKIRNKLTGER